MPWFRRRRDDRYDPYYDDDPRRWGYRGGGYGYRPRRGGSCLRDACLIESGCCIAEGLDGSCLLLAGLAAVQLSLALVRGGARTGRGGPAAVIVESIRVYQREISSRRSACCRFSPTCSEYGARAIQTHGARRGLVMLAKRLFRCRPGGARGPDPVPERRLPAGNTRRAV